MSTRYRIITESCEPCEQCIGVCSQGAITADPYTINPYLCDGCGFCADTCPYEAIEEYEWAEPPIPIYLLPMTLTLTMKMSEEV